MYMKQWEQNSHIQPVITVLLAVYNKPKELKMCLEAYKSQSFISQGNNNFELILADDGSSPEIEKIFSEFSREVPFRTVFLWQQDSGWGKLRMLNWAIVQSHADQIVFTDGDCVPHKDFVMNHLKNFSSETVSCGRRVDLLKEAAEKISVEDIRAGVLESPFWLLKNIFSGKIDYGGQGFLLPGWLAKTAQTFSTNKEPTILGCNFSVHKKWLFEVNGFDESFSTPGMGEDTDLERRLKMIGLKMKWVTYRAIQFHFWHRLTNAQNSDAFYENLKKNQNPKAVKGIDELEKFLNSDHSQDIPI